MWHELVLWFMRNGCGEQVHTLWEFLHTKSKGRKQSISNFHSPSLETSDSVGKLCQGVQHSKVSSQKRGRIVVLSCTSKCNMTVTWLIHIDVSLLRKEHDTFMCKVKSSLWKREFCGLLLLLRQHSVRKRDLEMSDWVGRIGDVVVSL